MRKDLAKGLPTAGHRRGLKEPKGKNFVTMRAAHESPHDIERRIMQKDKNQRIQKNIKKC